MSALLPLFPLQLVVLPGAAVPLHIFEDRYREMVGEAETAGTEFGIVLAKNEGILNVGCTVSVEAVLRRYPDGRFDVMTRGRRRFRIVSIDREKAYLRGAVEFFDDDDPKPPVIPALHTRAIEALRARAIEAFRALDQGELDASNPLLSFELARVVDDLDVRSALQVMRSETDRLTRLIEFLEDYVPKREYAEENKAHRANQRGGATGPRICSRDVRTPTHSTKRSRDRAPLGLSTVLHGAVFGALMLAPSVQIPQREKSEYKLAIEGKEEKLVWYKFSKLPDVTPPRPKKQQADRRPLQAENKAPQQIVASKKSAPKRTQIVLTDAPELPDLAPIESPNLLAMRVKLPARPFVPPDLVKRQQARVELAADAPQIAPPVEYVDLPSEKVPKFVKKFVAPPKHVPEKIAEVALPSDAPQLTASNVSAATPDFKTKFAPKPFTAPAAPAKSAASTDGAFAAGTPPELAVVGLKPMDVPASVPSASSPAQFSAAPQIRPNGADAAPGDTKGLTVPDLFVRGAPDAKPNLLAEVYAAPTSHTTAREAMRLAAGGVPHPADADPGDAIAAQSRAGVVKVSSAPEARFIGRDVFMMAIQMPNLTSDSGSWLMWYSDRTSRTVGLAPIAPPIPHRKVDPKYVATAAADHVEGKVELACVIGREGEVSGVELVRGLDDRLNASAVEALRKWQFWPATREGQPIDVDVLVEIPFRLAPHAQAPY